MHISRPIGGPKVNRTAITRDKERIFVKKFAHVKNFPYLCTRKG